MSLGTYRTTILIIGDFLLLWAGLLLTLVIRYGDDQFWNALSLHIIPFDLIFALCILIFYISGLYNLRVITDIASHLKTLATSILAGAIISVLLFYFAPIFIITPKINLLATISVASLFLLGWRILFAKVIKSSSKIKLCIIGSSPDIQELSETITSYPQLGYRIVTRISPGDTSIALALSNHKIDMVVASKDIQSNPHLVQGVYDALGSGIRFIDAAQFYEQVMGKIPVSLISKIWFLENIAETEKNFFELYKRGIDIIFALALGVVTLPLFPLVALAIKIDSHGPVLLRQKRVGKMGKLYTHYKYRTMIALGPDGHAELHGAVWSQKNDARITKVGRILRATRIDELPQLWNVVRGELSFIGPRPERPELVEQLRQEIPFYDMRHLVRPGLSGWAQINPPYYYSSTTDTLLKLQYDLFYIKNRDIGLDLSIALKTLSVILSRQGR